MTSAERNATAALTESDAAPSPRATGSGKRSAKSASDNATATSHKALELDAFIPYRLSLLSHRMTLNATELDAGGGRLTVQEWRVLSIVADSGPLIPAEIRRFGTQDKSTISWAIKRLEQRGFLLRQPRARDARTFEVLLSESGWVWYRERMPIAEIKAKAILSKLTRLERTELARIIDKLDEPERSALIGKDRDGKGRSGKGRIGKRT